MLLSTLCIKKFWQIEIISALAAWSSGILFVGGVKGRESETHEGKGSSFLEQKKISISFIYAYVFCSLKSVKSFKTIILCYYVSEN
jgi:hypothetical protein